MNNSGDSKYLSSNQPYTGRFGRGTGTKQKSFSYKGNDKNGKFAGKSESRFNHNKSQSTDNKPAQEFKSNDKPFSFTPRSKNSSLDARSRYSNSDEFSSSNSRAGSRSHGRYASGTRVFNKAIGGELPIEWLEDKTNRENEHSRNKNADKNSRKERRHDYIRVAIGSQTRAAAARVLEAVARGNSLNEAFPQHCHALDERDTAFVKEIVFGTLRQRRLLMNTMLPMIEHKLPEKQRIVYFLIISAMYQLVFLQTPPHAVVSSTVSACGECGQKSCASMVNAVLRRFLRENMKLVEPETLAIKHSFPDWLADRIIETYGEQADEIMLNSNIKPPLTLRVENSGISTDDFLQSLSDKQLGASLLAPNLSPSAVLLDVATNVSEIPGFDKGLCSVQDLSAQLAAPLLELDEPNLQVLDCCCAPGGKTAHILDLNPSCLVTALDVDANRIQQTQSTLSRLGRNADLRVLDAQDLSSIKQMFDRILVDAPCSGTGVIRRHPDIKWLRRQKDIENLCAIQAKILDAAFDKLKPGGILLYTTCSILPEENVQQITAFLKRHADAQLKPFTLDGHTYQTWQRLPGEQNGDGFFYARIVKQA